MGRRARAARATRGGAARIDRRGGSDESESELSTSPGAWLEEEASGDLGVTCVGHLPVSLGWDPRDVRPRWACWRRNPASPVMTAPSKQAPMPNALHLAMSWVP